MNVKGYIITDTLNKQLATANAELGKSFGIAKITFDYEVDEGTVPGFVTGSFTVGGGQR